MSVMRIMSVIIMRVFPEIGFFGNNDNYINTSYTSYVCNTVMWAMSVTKVNLVMREISVTRAVIRKKKENAFVKK